MELRARRGWAIRAMLVLLAGVGVGPAAGLDEVVTRRVVRVQPFTTLSGAVLPSLELGVETYGTLRPAKDNVVLLSHYLAGDGHAAGRLGSASGPVGWWDELVGPGLAIDTDRFFVVSIDLPCGMKVKSPDVTTTGPSTIDPRTGRRYGLGFPALTVRDMVLAQRAILDAMGLGKLVAAIGPSMGGMIALQWAVELPDQVQLVVSASGPMTFTAAERAGQVWAAATVTSDPQWMFGEYADRGADPALGLAAALYGGEGLLLWMNLPQRLATTRELDANHYLWLSELHRRWELGSELGSRAAALRRVRARVVLVGSRDDLYVTPDELRVAARELGAAGVSSRIELVRGRHGHLSVLDDAPLFGPVIAQELAPLAP